MNEFIFLSDKNNIFIQDFLALTISIFWLGFHGFLYTGAMEEKLNVRMTALLNFAETYPFRKTNVPHDKCLGKSWNIVKISKLFRQINNILSSSLIRIPYACHSF